ncbi:MAG: carbon storage regulator CsrA [Melioribacteraceae bacterium]|jgi:carbon storage regulator|nr:carbon storage regulator CsrA [Melioribacteraceae bacterium]
MLVLSRRFNEEIKIGGNITIKILSITENSVKIGIDAPKEVQLYRGEVYEKVKESIIDAAKSVAEVNSDLGKFKIQKVKT